MQFSSKEINQEIRKEIWPLLRGQGFTKFTARNAWRFHPSTIDVVNFQSFNSNLAASLNCTSFSFAVNLGVYYLAVHCTPWASRYPVLYPSAPLAPRESACHARLHLKKGLSQPEYLRDDIWYIRPEGSNLAAVIEDARVAIGNIGLPWQTNFSNLDFALSEFLKSRRQDRVEYVGAAGTKKSAEVGSSVALELGDYDAAIHLWEAVVNNDFYARFPETIEMANEILLILRDLAST